MAAPLELILNALEALVKTELEKFKTHLTYVKIEGIDPIPEGHLENADSTAIAKLIMKNYPSHGGQVMKDVLDKTGRKDLVLKWFSDAGPPTRTRSGLARDGDAGPPPTKRVAGPGGQHPIDQLRLPLINKVTELKAILDQLFRDGAISKEGRNTVDAESTNEDKMRKLDSLLQSKKAKDFYYQALVKHEKYLLEDLEIHSSDDPSHMDIEKPRGTHNTDAIGSNLPGKKGPVEDKKKNKREPESGPSSDPTQKSEKEPEDIPYEMTNDPGYCLILDNETFNPVTGLKKRSGSEEDSLELARVFSWLGFTVIRCKDKTRDEMVEVLEFFADWDSLKGKNKLIGAEQWSGEIFYKPVKLQVPQHGDCFVCCILSHGDEEGISGEDGNKLTVRETRSLFSGKKCRDLFKKPKLFFIQACRGNKRQEKGLLEADDGGSKGSKSADSVPEYADFLHGFANIDQHISLRRTDTGTWYIQELCKQLAIGCKRGDDILRILTRVNAAVCKECDDVDVGENVVKEVKQSPGFESYLTKPLIFHRPATVLPPTSICKLCREPWEQPCEGTISTDVWNPPKKRGHVEDKSSVPTEESEKEPETSHFTPHKVRTTNEYRFQFPGTGLFHCNVTGLVFGTTGEGEVLYRTVQWEERWPQLTDGAPAGPLFDIQCPQKSVSQLHLRHCEVTLDDDLSVAHITDEGVNFLKPLKVTKTHVVVNVPHLSSVGLWISNLLFRPKPPKPTHGQVLLFLRPPSDRLEMKVFLLPSNALIEEVIGKPNNAQDKYIDTTAACFFTPNEVYSLHCPPHDAQPKASQPYRRHYGPNYHPTFEVFMDLNTEVLSLEVQGAKKKPVWTHTNLRVKACSSSVPETATERGAVAGPSSSLDVPEDMRQAIHFVDQNMAVLIQKVKAVKPILDTLNTDGFISDEGYNDVMSMKPEQEMMRKLLVLLNTKKAKYGFYRCLESNEKHLVNELK